MKIKFIGISLKQIIQSGKMQFASEFYLFLISSYKKFGFKIVLKYSGQK